jgi:hypothetical protein
MRTKLVEIFTLLMVALMVAGFAYAQWTETLVLEGTVKTGELELEWSCECWDNDDGLNDIGEVECSPNGDTLTITVTNAYPCYEVSGKIDIENVGSVPAVLVNYRVDLPNDVLLKDLGGYEYELYYDFNGNMELDDGDLLMATASLVFSGDEITQIHKEVYIGFKVHFTNPGLPENWSGTFKITLEFENWSPPID